MENLHPVLLVVLISFIPTIAGVTVLLLFMLKLSPVIFIPLVVVVAAALHSYFYAMYKFFKQGKLKRVTILAVALALMFIIPYTVYAVATPNWSFKVNTDKEVYKLGENVTITVTLSNKGYMTQSFRPGEQTTLLVVYVESFQGRQVMSFGYHLNTTELSFASGQSLEKTWVWNQTMYGEILSSHEHALIPLDVTGDYYVRADFFDAGYTVYPVLRDWVRIMIEP